jgi:hypothetical protein
MGGCLNSKSAPQIISPQKQPRQSSTTHKSNAVVASYPSIEDFLKRE